MMDGQKQLFKQTTAENSENTDLSQQFIKEGVKVNSESLNDDDQIHSVTRCFEMTVRNRKRVIIGNHLSENEFQQLQLVVNQYRDCFRAGILGVCTHFKHTINTGEHKPIHVPPYRRSREKRAITKE